ncbi:hypothetical protein D3C71_1389190 [compost metagenome]
MSVLRPYFKAAANSAEGTYRLGSLYSRFAHSGFHLGDHEDLPVTWLNLFGKVNHRFQHVRPDSGQITCFTQHRFLHKRITRAYGDTMAAGDTGRLINRHILIPNYPWSLPSPVNRERLIHLKVLTSFHAATAQNTLVRIIPVHRMRHIHLIGLPLEHILLMIQLQLLGRVMYNTVPVIVITHRTIQLMILQNPGHGFHLSLFD